MATNSNFNFTKNSIITLELPFSEHIEELLRYMKAFIKDVDIKYEQKLSELRGGM